MDEKDKPREPTYFEEHPALSGFAAGFGSGALEQFYNYAQKSGDKKAIARLEQELLKSGDPRLGTIKDDTTGLQRMRGFNEPTHYTAQQAKANQELIERLNEIQEEKKGKESGRS